MGTKLEGGRVFRCRTVMTSYEVLRRTRETQARAIRQVGKNLLKAQASLLCFKSAPILLLSRFLTPPFPHPSLQMTTLQPLANSEQRSTHTLCSSQLSPPRCTSDAPSLSTAFGPADTGINKSEPGLESGESGESSLSPQRKMRRQPSRAEKEATVQLESQLPGFLRCVPRYVMVR